MRCFWAVVVAALVASCGADAAVIEVRADDLAIPVELSAFCLAAADRDPGGGEFGRLYRFDEELTGLPQSLTIDPGSAEAAVVWARGYRAGIEVARDSAAIGFDGVDEVTLSLARCAPGSAGAIEAAGSADLGAAGLVAASYGRGGTVVVAVGPGVSVRLAAGDGGLAPLDGGAPVPTSGPPASLLSFDADGDCDDDLILVGESDPASSWRRRSDGSFEAVPEGFAGEPPAARAAAAADVDSDGDIDLVFGDATSVALWKNDGAGRFSEAPGAVATDAADVTALAFGDFDGDGDADLLVAGGREAATPVRLLLGDGSGALTQVEAAAPPVDLSVRALAVRDLDGDRVDDAVLAVAGAPLRIFAGRGDGRLEDRSFLFFPGGAPEDATAVAAADWDGDCRADLVVDGAAFRGTDMGMVAESGPDPAAAVAIFADADDDGAADVLAVGASGEVTWLRR